MGTSSMTDTNPTARATEPVAKRPATVSPMDNILIADCHFHNYPCTKALASIKVSKAIHP